MKAPSSKPEMEGQLEGPIRITREAVEGWIGSFGLADANYYI